MKLSLRVAALSTLVATIFGTLIALALCRYKLPRQPAVNLLLVLPLTTPEVVLGSSLLSLFLDLNVRTGFSTIVIAHIMFSVSYVALMRAGAASGGSTGRWRRRRWTWARRRSGCSSR